MTESKIIHFESTSECLERAVSEVLTDTDSVIMIWDEKVFSEKDKVSNDNVGHIFLDGGEGIKSRESFDGLIEKLLNSGVHRNTHLIAVGGGGNADRDVVDGTNVYKLAAYQNTKGSKGRFKANGCVKFSDGYATYQVGRQNGVTGQTDHIHQGFFPF